MLQGGHLLLCLLQLPRPCLKLARLTLPLLLQAAHLKGQLVTLGTGHTQALGQVISLPLEPSGVILETLVRFLLCF